ncbi:MAG: UDP-N-acetylglucosamine 2-epimerase (hydrolyzing) [Elusimicrobia bacterium]|nr:UDP-N-acetylglucosamine 2-epimerase (hydrolyzing) [Elusimicrobiota bacterium]
MKRRKIAILTGTRAEYGILTSVMDAIRKHPRMDYSLIVTGMHLSHEYGYTLREIEKDGYRIGAKVDMLVSGSTGAAMAKTLGMGIIGMAQALDQIRPDILLILGDRGEPLAGAIAAAHMNIPVAHMHGGEVSGTIDESIRHAITRFAHIHFPATRKSVERLIKMGEDPKRIFLVGSAGVDAIRNKSLSSKKKIAQHFGFNPGQPILLAIQHPVTTEITEASQNMKAFVDALIALDQQTVFIYPNSDAGNKEMVEVMRREVDRLAAWPRARVFKSLPHELYLGTMRHAAVMIGNSSSGLIEAPSLRIPYILVGTRQNGRERSSNVKEIEYNSTKIIRAAKAAITQKTNGKSYDNPYDPYGDGRAGERIAQTLSCIRIDKNLIQKKLAY